MYLSSVIYSLLPDPVYKKPKDDYASYFDDMYKFSGGYLDREMLMQKSGYAFSELLNRAVNQNEKILPLLQQADVCILMNTSYEYDSHHSNIASYLKDYYTLNANIFDVAEQGCFGLISALHLLSALFSQQKIIRGLVIGFEQRALPLRVKHHQELPQYNGVGLIELFSENHTASSLKIIEADIISEKDIAEKIRVLEENNSLRCYLLVYQSDPVTPDFLSHQEVSFIDIAEGVLPLFLFFDQLQKQVVSTMDPVLHVVLIENISHSGWFYCGLL